jgi:hypothetical protein
MHDDAQLAGGLYAPLIVLEPGEKYDPETDHIVVIGLNGVIQEDQWATPSIITFNGKTTPDPIIMRADVPNRLRLINITANGGTMANVEGYVLEVFQRDGGTWKVVATSYTTKSPPATTSRKWRRPKSPGHSCGLAALCSPPTLISRTAVSSLLRSPSVTPCL